MSRSAPMTVDDLMGLGPVIPVITIEQAEDASPLVRALVAGGIRVVEFTLRTRAALDALTAANDVEGAIVGAGTVLNATDAQRAKSAGAQFLVSPGLTRDLAEAARQMGLPFLPGIATPSDVMNGLELGIERFQFFPAEAGGGVAAMKAFRGPFPQIRFCPTGGITQSTAPEYLALPNVACVGGTWIAPKSAIDARDWTFVEGLAKKASALRS